MSQEQLIIKSSPFAFLKWLALILFFLPILSLILSVIINLEGQYGDIGLEQTISFGYFFSFFVTGLQFLIALVAFFIWYNDAYNVDKEAINHRTIIGKRMLIATQEITQVEISQGVFGRMFDAATLVIQRNHGEIVRLRNIPNPEYYAAKIQSLVIPKDHALTDKQKLTQDIIKDGESQFVEFKSSFLWDYRRQSANKDLYYPTMKNVTAFMNSHGGVVIIGVDDEGEILGIEKDLQSMRKGDVDGFELTFNSVFNSMIGVQYRHYVELNFEDIENKTICIIRVTPTPEPVYITNKGNEEFYVKAGNQAQSMTISEALHYINAHFSA